MILAIIIFIANIYNILGQCPSAILLADKQYLCKQMNSYSEELKVPADGSSKFLLVLSFQKVSDCSTPGNILEVRTSKTASTSLIAFQYDRPKILIKIEGMPQPILEVFESDIQVGVRILLALDITQKTIYYGGLYGSFLSLDTYSLTSVPSVLPATTVLYLNSGRDTSAPWGTLFEDILVGYNFDSDLDTLASYLISKTSTPTIYANYQLNQKSGSQIVDSSYKLGDGLFVGHSTDESPIRVLDTASPNWADDGTGLIFTNTNDRVELPTTVLSKPSGTLFQYSQMISLFIFVNSEPESDDPIVTRATQGGDYVFEIRLESSMKLSVQVNDEVFTSSRTIKLNVWTLIDVYIWAFKSSSILSGAAMYIDGTLANSPVHVDSWQTTETFQDQDDDLFTFGGFLGELARVQFISDASALLTDECSSGLCQINMGFYYLQCLAPVCSENQYPLGSHYCGTCDETCKTCSGYGSNSCKSCENGFQLSGSNSCEANSVENDEGSKSKSAIPGWAIALIVIGSCIFLGFFIAMTFYCTRKIKNRSKLRVYGEVITIPTQEAEKIDDKADDNIDLDKLKDHTENDIIDLEKVKDHTDRQKDQEQNDKINT